MKIKYLVLGLIMSTNIMPEIKSTPKITSLPKPPEELYKFKEMALSFNGDVVDLYNSLSPEERIFAYYIYRASLPGNRIVTDQTHRYGLRIIDLFETLHDNKDKIKLDENDLKTYLVYLWTNHGQYFNREMSEEKRTPSKLGLKSLTKKSVLEALTTINSNQLDTFEELAPYIFDENLESTVTIPDNIEKSAVNIYSPDFKTEHYQQLSNSDKNKINAYFYLENDKPKMKPYCIGKKYDKELSVAHYWLSKAYTHAKNNPKYFDINIVNSLKYLCQYLKNGDEELFKKYSKEWLKSDCRIDYNFGFIEVYMDPMARRGSFEAEVTVKSMDIKKLNAMLPEIENKLPIPKNYKRENTSFIPNASVNTLIFGAGDLGPIKSTAAYCLPNYEEIRSEDGSKQIIYASSKSIGTKLNPELSRKLFNSKDNAKWLNKIDPDREFGNDLWNLQCILHETLGHGSGRLDEHTFKEGENLTIGKKTYNIGDTIKVTSSNISEFLAGYDSALEELRAEIIALYVSVEHLDELLSKGFLTKWADKMSRACLQEKLILHMAGSGLSRQMQQSDTATKIAGAHAQANSTIMNFLIDHGGVERIREKVKHDGKEYEVVDLKIKDLRVARELVKKLMIKVQTIKSTGDSLGVKDLIETYGIPLRHPEDMKTLKINRQAISGDIKAGAHIFPKFLPIKNGDDIVDIQAAWPEDIFDLYKHYSQIEMSRN